MSLPRENEYLILLAISILFLGVSAFKYKKVLLHFIEIVFKKNVILGTFLFLILCTMSSLLLIPITPFNILALYLYNPIPAFMMAMLAHIITALVGYYIAKQFEPNIIKDKLNKFSFFDLVSKKNNLTREEWLELSILTRVSPNFPFALISYLWGFTAIPIPEYLIGVVVGTIPYLLVEMYIIYSAGRFIKGERNYTIIMSVIVTLLLSYGIDRFVDHLIKEKEKKHK